MKFRCTPACARFVAVVATATSLCGQVSTAVAGIDGVPRDRRAILIQRIEQLVVMYRARDWPAVYSNLTRLPPIQETVIQFSQRLAQAYPRNVGKSFVAFVPDSVVPQPFNQWAVWGCATLQGKGEARTRERWIVIASWERGGWFFSEVLPAAQLDAKKPMPCTDQPRR